MTDANGSATKEKSYDGFTEEERAAMKERSQELKKSTRRKAAGAKVDGEADALAKIAEMSVPDKAIAERLHAIIKEYAPELSAKTWYGMPAYAKDGQVVCFFQPADKFKARYPTLGFNDPAKLDDGNMWPTSYALTKLTAADEPKVIELIKKAVG